MKEGTGGFSVRTGISVFYGGYFQYNQYIKKIEYLFLKIKN